MIELRRLEDADMTLMESWLKEPHIAAWYHDSQDWLQEVRERAGAFRWLNHLIVMCEGRAIGFCQYYRYADGGETWHGDVEVEGTFSIDYMIGEAAYLRKGLGKEIVQALLQRARQAGARRVIGQPEEENVASCRTLLACGFEYDRKNALYQYDWREEEAP